MSTTDTPVDVPPGKLGDAAEAQVIARLAEHGYSVSTPWGDSDRYDLILDEGDELQRVQIKRAWYDKPSLVFNVCSSDYDSDTTYTSEEIDLFIVFSPKTDSIYRVDVDETPGSKMHLRLGDRETANRAGGSKWAEDYLFFD